MGWFSDLWSGKKARIETEPYGKLNPEQIALTQKLGPYLTSMVGQELPQYTGDYAAAMSPEELQVQEQESRLRALGVEGLTPLIQGKFPEEYWQESIYKPAMKDWREDIQPSIEEQYAGPGEGYWGSARAGAVATGARDLTDQLINKRAELGWQAQQNIPTALNAMTNLMEKGALMQSTQRLIQDRNLTGKYNEWVRTRPENQSYIDQALNFLQLQTTIRQEYEGSEGVSQMLTDSLKKLVVSGTMAALTGGIGGAAGSSGMTLAPGAV